MKSTKCFDKYPHWIIITSNMLQLTIYLIGAFIIYLLGIIWLLFYLIYIIILEMRLLRKSCVNCYYYGKRCAFGKGKVCAILFKKGDPKKFSKDHISWIDILPDFLISIIPLIIALYLLILNFNIVLLFLVVLLVFLTFIGNSIIRGSLACKYCSQRKLGCPAEQLFSKKSKNQ